MTKSPELIINMLHGQKIHRLINPVISNTATHLVVRNLSLNVEKCNNISICFYRVGMHKEEK